MAPGGQRAMGPAAPGPSDRRYASPPVPVLLASVTDSLVTFATNVVSDLGIAGIFVLMTLESACIPIPSEATMLFAGFNVANGHYPLWQPVVVATIANVVGSW